VSAEIQMPRVFSPDAVTASPTAAPSSRGDRPLGWRAESVSDSPTSQ
jgi:hypothetical protein